MSTFTAVLLVDNQASGRKILRSLNRNRRNTLVVSHPDDLRGHTLPQYVRVLDHTDRMSARHYKEIQEQLKICQVAAERDLNDEVLAEFAAELTAVVDGRLQDALHCGEPAALLAAALLEKLAEQAFEAWNCRLTPRTLKALSALVLGELPECIRTYRRDMTAPASVVNAVSGPIGGSVVQAGVVHGVHAGGPPNPAAAAAVQAGLEVLARSGVTRVHVSY
jgi:hypothetical protein